MMHLRAISHNAQHLVTDPSLFLFLCLTPYLPSLFFPPLYFLPSFLFFLPFSVSYHLHYFPATLSTLAKNVFNRHYTCSTHSYRFFTWSLDHVWNRLSMSQTLFKYWSSFKILLQSVLQWTLSVPAILTVCPFNSQLLFYKYFIWGVRLFN